LHRTTRRAGAGLVLLAWILLKGRTLRVTVGLAVGRGVKPLSSQRVLLWMST
jgi:hypothetical protein